MFYALMKFVPSLSEVHLRLLRIPRRRINGYTLRTAVKQKFALGKGSDHQRLFAW